MTLGQARARGDRVRGDAGAASRCSRGKLCRVRLYLTRTCWMARGAAAVKYSS